MNILIDEHKKLLIELIAAKIDFILVGGYAVIFHGYTRTTGDMDIWLKPTNQNRDFLVPVLEKIGILPEDIDLLRSVDFTKTIAFHVDDYPKRVDFLTGMSGLVFEEAYQNRSLLPLGEYSVPILRLDDLLVNKLMSGRLKDMSDVEELQKIMKLKKDKF